MGQIMIKINLKITGCVKCIRNVLTSLLHKNTKYIFSISISYAI